jgi:hypothetical protein
MLEKCEILMERGNNEESTNNVKNLVSFLKAITDGDDNFKNCCLLMTTNELDSIEDDMFRPFKFY